MIRTHDCLKIIAERLYEVYQLVSLQSGLMHDEGRRGVANRDWASGTTIFEACSY